MTPLKWPCLEKFESLRIDSIVEKQRRKTLRNNRIDAMRSRIDREAFGDFRHLCIFVRMARTMLQQAMGLLFQLAVCGDPARVQSRNLRQRSAFQRFLTPMES